MPGNDWNNLGNDIKNIVQDAVNTGDFNRLNHDLGITLENALGNMAESVKNAAKNGTRNTKNTAGKDARNGQNHGRSGEGNGDGYRRDAKFEYDCSHIYNNNGQRERYDSSYASYMRNGFRYRDNRKVQEAREKFALYVNTGAPRALGIIGTALGFTMTGAFALTSAILGICAVALQSPPAGLVATGGAFLAATVGSGALSMWVNSFRKRVSRFRSYVKTLNGRTYAEIEDLAKNVKKSEKFVRKDLKKMIEKKMFLEGHLDEGETCLISSNESYSQYLEMKRQAEEEKARQEQLKKEQEAYRAQNPYAEEVEKVIAEGNAYIEEIRRSNDAIPGVEISNKMYHLENVIRRIFKRVEQHPELIDDLHKFMDYYLPTTVKLLKAYEELDKQDVAGDNIKTAKQEIENTLDTINDAFENLLDSFFKDTAWDVSTDISVLKTMLAQEGLTGKKDFQEKE